MLKIHTGSNRLLSDKLCKIVRSELPDKSIFVVVPRQLTLLSEQIIMKGLSIDSTFSIQVYNSTRICKLIFDESGYPAGKHIDERGRVMLCRRAVHDVRDQLSIYKDAEKHVGFAEKCAEQIESLIQGGVDYMQLMETAESDVVSGGGMKLKLHDLGIIMQRYTELTEGLYNDTETDLIAATARVGDAPFIKDACFIFYGFAIVPTLLTNFVAAVAKYASSTHILLPIAEDSFSEQSCYIPIRKTLERLLSACNESEVPTELEKVAESEGSNAITAYSRQMYSAAPVPFTGDFTGIHKYTTRTIREECRYAASVARQLCREKGIRYGEMQILCTDPTLYASSLKESFEAYNVPLMNDSGRPVSRIGAAQLLLLALKTVIEGYRRQDVLALVRTGFCGMSHRDTDYLENYAVSFGIDGPRWTRPFNRGREEELKHAEQSRIKLIEPLEKLYKQLRSAKKLQKQLTAMFEYLSSPEVNALTVCRNTCRMLSETGNNEEACLISQSWNRLISTFDMMNDLLGEEALSPVELYRTLSSALDVSLVKILPQSSDAVYVQSTDTMLQQHPKVLFVMGLYDRTYSKSDALLLPAQQKLVEAHTGAYIGPDTEDLSLQRRYYLTESVAMASGSIYLSCSMVDFDGASHKFGEEMRALSAVFPDLTADNEDDVRKAMISAPEPAFEEAAYAFGNEPGEYNKLAKLSLEAIAVDSDDYKNRLERLNVLSNARSEHQTVDPSVTESLYKDIDDVSITRLELFARCPFAHFIQYGLRPHVVKPFEMDFADSGTFLHGCMNAYLKTYKEQLKYFTPEEASKAMRVTADEYLSTVQRAAFLIEDSPSAAQQYEDLIQRACHSAVIISEQMKNSLFNISDTESAFDALEKVSGVSMNGSIDRIDTWNDGNRVRIIDFKSSEKKLDPAALLDGSALQLAIYMGVARDRVNASCAGMYYFPMLSPYISSDSLNPIELDELRKKSMKMSGMFPKDPDVNLAQNSEPDKVFDGGINKDGVTKENTAAATDPDFDRVITHARGKVSEHISEILNGNVDVSPLNSKNTTPCTYCDHRSACFFDPSLNRDRKRRNITWSDFFKELVLESSD